MKFISGVCAAIAISAVGMVVTFAEASAFGMPDTPMATQAPATPQAPPTPRAPATPQVVSEKVTPQQSMAKNLTESVTAVGCVRAWKPAPEDVTKNARER